MTTVVKWLDKLGLIVTSTHYFSRATGLEVKYCYIKCQLPVSSICSTCEHLGMQE